MANVKCEYCGFEQDPATSILCDNCGRRLTRTREDADLPTAEVVEEEFESMRCPICGVPSSQEICQNCGAKVRARAM